jgi:hypothetical protein
MVNRSTFWCCLIALTVALPSRGQEAGTASGLPELVVLDCGDYSSYRGHLLSWRAADALALAIEARGRWEVTPRRQVRREIEARELAPPFAAAHAQLLGDVLGASFAARGIVQSCDVSDEGAQVKLSLAVDVIDVRSGETLASETAAGTARASGGDLPIIDVQVSEALARAAEAVAGKLPTFRRVKGMVYALLRKRQALINLGREHGIKKGIELAVYREVYDEEARAATLRPVGRVKVVEVNATDSTARIMKGGQPLQRQDVIQALLPVAGPAASPPGSSSPPPLAKPPTHCTASPRHCRSYRGAFVVSGHSGSGSAAPLGARLADIPRHCASWTAETTFRIVPYSCASVCASGRRNCTVPDASARRESPSTRFERPT